MGEERSNQDEAAQDTASQLNQMLKERHFLSVDSSALSGSRLMALVDDGLSAESGFLSS